MNVSSIVVKTTPERVEGVKAGIKLIELCEVHFSDSDGRIVVTIEGKSIHDQMEKLKRIQSIPFVLNASLMYLYCEDELTEALKQRNDKPH